MAKPTDLPEWATAGAITEPGSGKKATGWVAGEQPPAEYFNWLQNLAYQWTAYLDRLTEGDEGDWRLSSTYADAAEPVLEVVSMPEDDSTAWKPIVTWQAGADRWCGIYSGRVSGGPAIALVMNARWDVGSGTWVQTLSSRYSAAVVWDDTNGHLRMFREVAGAGSWSTWTNRTALEVSGIDASVSILTTDAHITDDMQVDDDLDVGGDADVTGALTVTGAVSTAGQYTYTSPKSVSRRYSAAAMRSTGTYTLSGGIIVGSAGGTSEHRLYVPKPADATLSQIVVSYAAADVAGVTLQAFAYDSDGNGLSCRAAGAVAAPGATAGAGLSYVCDQNHNHPPSTHAYQIAVTLGADTDNQILSVQVIYSLTAPQAY